VIGERHATITFKGRRAGILRETPNGGTSFTYDPGWTDTIACALPVSERIHDRTTGLHPFFAHLAPEGWLRERQSAFAEVDREDDFGILLAFGADCIGAVGIVDPEGSHDRVLLKETNNNLDQAISNTERTISGVQAKTLCDAEGNGFLPASANSPALHIAKYPSETLQDMVMNEVVTLELCRILLGKDEVVAAKTALVDGINGVALVVRRFDRSGNDGRTKLRCEDFMQVLSLPPGRDHKGKYRAGYDAIGQALQWSDAPILDARRAYLRLAAFVIVGNVDCHLKNWSLLETPEGFRLSPAYDVLNGYIYGAEQFTTRFGLQIGDDRVQWEEYDRELLLSLAEPVGLERRVAAKLLDTLQKKEKAFFKRLAQPLGLNENRTWDYRNSVRTAWERIYG